MKIIYKSLLLSAILISCCFASTQALRVTIVNDTNGKIDACLYSDVFRYRGGVNCHAKGIVPREERDLEVPADENKTTKVAIYFNHVYHHSDNYPDDDRVVSSEARNEVQDGDRLNASEFIERYYIGIDLTWYRYHCEAARWQEIIDNM